MVLPRRPGSLGRRLVDAWDDLSRGLVVVRGLVGDHVGMPRRAVYVTGWVVVTTVATVVGLAAVGVVRGAVQGNDTVTALSQQQVTEQLNSLTPTAGATTPVSGQSSLPASRAPQGHVTSAPGTSATGPSSTHSSSSAPVPAGTQPTQPTQPGQTATGPTTTTRTAQPQTTPSPSESEHATPTPSPTRTTAPSSYQAFTSAGGTVYASCTNGQVSGRAVPANGYSIGEQELGPDTHIKVEFVSGSSKITVQVYCSGTTMTSQVSTASGD